METIAAAHLFSWANKTFLNDVLYLPPPLEPIKHSYYILILIIKKIIWICETIPFTLYILAFGLVVEEEFGMREKPWAI